MKVILSQATTHPSFWIVQIIVNGRLNHYVAFMDDFGTLAKVDHQKLAILFNT